jgi:hypothetical protein
MLDLVHPLQLAPRERRLLMRLCLLAFCGGLLLLLSSRPAEAAGRREPKLLDPVRTTLKATAREVDSFAGRATGSGSSMVAKVAPAARQVATRQVAAPHPRPASGGTRSAAPRRGPSHGRPDRQAGRPAVTSPVRRAAPSTHPATCAARTAARSATATTKSVTGTATGPLERAAKLAAGPLGRVGGVAGGPLGRVGGVADGPLGQVAGASCAPLWTAAGTSPSGALGSPPGG